MAGVRQELTHRVTARLEWSRDWRGAAWAALLYSALAVVWTWPLATAISRSVPADMGDPVLNTWILHWTSAHIVGLASLDWSAWHDWWNPGIFHPAPLALAYSEHLTAQALLMLPLHVATGNAVLCYNVSLLLTFVLSALGAFLLARDLTGNTLAATLAGLFFGFAPYRMGQLSHMQVLSSQWMPLSIYAVRRHLQTGSRWSLAGFTASAILQNLSCSYFLVYFSPFLALWVAGEITARHRWRDRALLLRLATAGALILVVTAPFLLPYYRLRELGFNPRSITEVRRYSADVTAYWTVAPKLWLWGSTLGKALKPENELFPGLVPIALAIVALAAMAITTARNVQVPPVAMWRRVLAAVAALASVAAIAMTAQALVSGRLVWPTGTSVLRKIRLPAVLETLLVAPLVLACVSAHFRATARAALRRVETWLALGTLTAVVFSFGPTIDSHGLTLLPQAPYLLCYLYVPGVDGLRVPARLAMVAILFLAILAACGVAAVVDRWRRTWPVCACLGILFLLEARGTPLPLDRTVPSGRFAAPTGRLLPLSAPPPIYDIVATLPSGAALVELPYGIGEWELRAMYYSLAHRRPIVNGYSGGAPEAYQANITALQHPLLDRSRAWDRLQSLPVTHILVHEGAFPNGEGPAITSWLQGHGAVERGRFGRDVLLQLP